MGFAPPPHNLLKKVDENFKVCYGKFSSDFYFFLLKIYEIKNSIAEIRTIVAPAEVLR